MEFIKRPDGNYIIKDSGYVISEKEKLQMENKELVIKDISETCAKETVKKIEKNKKRIKELSDIIVKDSNRAVEVSSELNDLRLTNDEDYARAASSVDLEEIRRVAIGELGMRYAKEGQIINVSGEGNDYVRQLADIQE